MLRAILRIASDSAGISRESADGERIDLPLGLVALYWVRSFLPLVDADLPQHPNGNARMGFVKAGFRALDSRSRFDLRVGRRFTGDDAEHLVAALRDATRCIRNMPAHYTTYPGGAEPVFRCTAGRGIRTRDTVVLDEPYLWQFGTLSVPRHIWRAMSRYTAWIEPSIVGEWTDLMRSYGGPSPAGRDACLDALRWLDPQHDTSLVRRIAQDLRARSRPLHCVWTGSRLRREFAVDHCFPFAAWPCNDLWNLVPTSMTINSRKGDRLPSAYVLEHARERLLDWWNDAYGANAGVRNRFEKEASSALPAIRETDDGLSDESIFEGVMLQRAVLQRVQQLAEWSLESG